jgi:hypothetical protein
MRLIQRVTLTQQFGEGWSPVLITKAPDGAVGFAKARHPRLA